MSDIIKISSVIDKTQKLSSDVFDMWINAREIALKAKAGQFVNLFCKENSRLLPRPISICEIDRELGRIRLVYRTVGEGTKEFSSYNEGDEIEVMGPLGNGFTIEGDNPILIGGGVGIPPMLQLAKEFNGNVQIVLGYRDELFLNEDFEKYGKVYISTEDGSIGTKGNVIDAINQNNITGDNIFACGPTPMLRGIKEYASTNKIRAQISMEERMACGIGACLACTCQSVDKDHHTNVNNKRICKDGPVFYSEEVEL